MRGTRFEVFEETGLEMNLDLRAGEGQIIRSLPGISAKIMRGAGDERMVFAPEGQHDNSRARSAWNHEENRPRPSGTIEAIQYSPTTAQL